jgi:hypothetical protein
MIMADFAFAPAAPRTLLFAPATRVSAAPHAFWSKALTCTLFSLGLLGGLAVGYALVLLGLFVYVFPAGLSVLLFGLGGLFLIVGGLAYWRLQPKTSDVVEEVMLPTPAPKQVEIKWLESEPRLPVLAEATA